MDISAQSWKRGVRYSKDDIVKIENLTNINDFFTPPENPIKTDDSTWASIMNQMPGEGWGHDPNHLKYTNLIQKPVIHKITCFFITIQNHLNIPQYWL